MKLRGIITNLAAELQSGDSRAQLIARQAVDATELADCRIALGIDNTLRHGTREAAEAAETMTNDIYERICDLFCTSAEDRKTVARLLAEHDAEQQATIVQTRVELAEARDFIVAEHNKFYDYHPYAHELRARYPWLEELANATAPIPGGAAGVREQKEDAI